MKFLIVLLAAAVSAQVTFASSLKCKNTYSEENVLTLTAKFENQNTYSSVHLFSDSDFLGKTNEVFVIAKYDPTYKPTKKHSDSIRYNLMKSPTAVSSYSLLLPKTIATKAFPAVLTNDHEGYHGETGYHKLTCTLN